MSTFNTYKYFNNRRLVENNEMMEEDILNPVIKFDVSEKLYKILKDNPDLLDTSMSQFHYKINDLLEICYIKNMHFFTSSNFPSRQIRTNFY